jgi:hypothetical protein
MIEIILSMGIIFDNYLQVLYLLRSGKMQTCGKSYVSMLYNYNVISREQLV